MLNQTDHSPHINPRYRAYGRARLEIARRAHTRQDWDLLWKRPQYSFPFVWGRHWRQCIEYRVDDFAAELGFLIDVLGLPVNAFNPSYAMFTSPDNEFYFAVVPASPEAPSTPPDAIRIQFMVDDIFATTTELERRGITIVSPPQPVAEGSLQWVASFATPHGICMELWGMVEQEEEVDDGDEPGEAVEPALDLELPLTELVAAQQSEFEDDEHLPAPVEPAHPRRAAPEPLERLFKSGQEMLAHLQQQGRLSTVLPSAGTHPAQSPAFRPAPKPQPTDPMPALDQPSDVAEPDQLPPEPYHYKPITFHDET